MRILFLCSCLEPGRDGVGDYVRLLARACARLGHECAIAALNDSFVHHSTESTEERLRIVRLPSCGSWADLNGKAQAFREEFKPDWISLQLVPYAFNKRGMLFNFASSIRPIIGRVPLHIMFHELWLGAGRPSPLRFHVTGFFQRIAIRRLLAELKPELVTASNPVHVEMLRTLGTNAAILPLFGNVPIAPGDFPVISKILAGTGITTENRAESWIGLFFGSLHPEWKPEPFMTYLESAARKAGKKICLILSGRTGTYGDEIWQKMQRDYGSRCAFLNLGEQPAELLSALLQSADFGIAASPWQLIGKSGTVAAMLDHGLPVVVTRDDFHPFQKSTEPPSSDPLVHRCDDRIEAKLVAGLPKRPPQARVDRIAAQLCDKLATPHPANT